MYCYAFDDARLVQPVMICGGNAEERHSLAIFAQGTAFPLRKAKNVGTSFPVSKAGTLRFIGRQRDGNGKKTIYDMCLL